MHGKVLPHHRTVVSKRKLTDWGYGTDTTIGDFSMVGVPTLSTNVGDYSLAPRLTHKPQ